LDKIERFGYVKWSTICTISATVKVTHKSSWLTFTFARHSALFNPSM